jgi:putative spermidine/putrescine transport system permease protein
MALPTYASPLERVWYYTYLVICALVFLFLIAPILIVIPLSFNAEPYFTFTEDADLRSRGLFPALV